MEAEKRPWERGGQIQFNDVNFRFIFTTSTVIKLTIIVKSEQITNWRFLIQRRNPFGSEEAWASSHGKVKEFLTSSWSLIPISSSDCRPRETTGDESALEEFLSFPIGTELGKFLYRFTDSPLHRLYFMRTRSRVWNVSRHWGTTTVWNNHGMHLPYNTPTTRWTTFHTVHDHTVNHHAAHLIKFC